MVYVHLILCAQTRKALSHACAMKALLLVKTSFVKVKTTYISLFDILYPCGPFSDIDECDTSMFDCIPEAMCENTIGSYQCTCLPGYTGNGTVCEGKLL